MKVSAGLRRILEKFARSYRRGRASEISGDFRKVQGAFGCCRVFLEISQWGEEVPVRYPWVSGEFQIGIRVFKEASEE